MRCPLLNVIQRALFQSGIFLYHFGIFSVTLQAQIQKITCSAHRHSCQSRLERNTWTKSMHTLYERTRQ